MPSTHIKSFKARYYECDPFGHLRPINFLRWMQEAAFEASEAVGYDFSHYDQLGQLWLVRETDIQYLKPLRYGDEVEIKTWVLDFRHFRSKRAYEIRCKDTHQVLACATTDWVYLDAELFRPVPIPDEMKSAFFPEGLPLDPPKRNRFPKSPPHQGKHFSFRRTVDWYDIDRMWHVNNAVYLNYFEETELRLCAKLGWSMRRMHAEGIRLDTCSQHIEYLQPARYGDFLEISTWHSDIQSETAIRHYEIHRVTDGDLLVRARSQWGFSDIKTCEPRHIPADILRAISI